MVVLALGVVGLAFGILLIVAAGSAQGEVIKRVKDEHFPVITHTGEKELTMTAEIIDTAEEIENTAEAIRDARWQAGIPADLTGTITVNMVTPMGTVPVSQVNCVVGESLFNSALGSLALAGLVRYIGIATLILGIALILAGFLLYRVIART